MATSRLHQPHDRLFKQAFSSTQNVAGELEAVLPPSLFALLATHTLELESGTFIKPEDGSELRCDLLFSVNIAGQPGYVYVLFEHQSSDDRSMPVRLLGYMANIWTAHLRDRSYPLPPIIALLLQHDPKSKSPPEQLSELLTEAAQVPELSAYIPDFRIVVDDLNRRTDAELKARTVNDFCRIALWLLRDSRKPGEILRAFDQWSEYFTNVANSETGIDALTELFRYISSQLPAKEYQQLGAHMENLGPSVEEAFVSHTDYVEARGKSIGIAEGKSIGITEGKSIGIAEDIVRLCKAFDIELTPERKEKLGATPEELRTLFDAVLERRAWPE